MDEIEDFSSLPLDQRLDHKLWKARLGAYTEIKTIFKRLDPETEAAQFNKYENSLSKMILDTNMAAQEAGVLAVIEFVGNAPNPTRHREEIVAGIVSKCLAATKAGTRTHSVELLLLLSEVDTPSPVVTGIIDGFDAKQPKSVAASVAAVRQIVHAYGVKFINSKLLLKALVKPFTHKDKTVRAETQLLAVELFRWMGQAIMPFLQELSPVLLKELEAQFSKAANDPPPKQERMLRSQQEASEISAPLNGSHGGISGENAGEMTDGLGEAPAGVDPWDLVDAVDITNRLPDDFYQFLTSSKWKERKQVVEELHNTLKKSIRLQFNSGTGDVIQELGKKIGDVNITVATLVIQCLGLFASALRQPFSPYIQSTLPALVEKSKERKQSVIDAIREATDAYFAAAGFDMTAIGDHYFTGASHKNPQVRAESNHFLRRCFAVIPKRPGKTEIKRYSDQLKSGLEDGDANVREAAAECLGTLSKLVTPKTLEPFIEGVDKIKLDKISEYTDKATVKVKATARPNVHSAAPGNTGANQRAPGAATTTATTRQVRMPAKPAQASIEDSEESGSSGGLGANLPPHIRKKLEASAKAAALKKAQREGRTLDEPASEPEPAPSVSATVVRPKVAVAAPPPKRMAPPAVSRKALPPASATSTNKGKAIGGKSTSEAIKMYFASDESLDEKIANAFPGDILAGFESTKWKDRMEAMDQLKEYLGDQLTSGSPVQPELVIRQLARKPGWKESNFQVNARAFQIIEWMAGEGSLDFNTGAAALCASALVDKLGDIKLKTPASNALVSIAQRYTLKFVIGIVESSIRNQKSPKVIADCMAWLDTQILEFGVKGLVLRPIINMVKDVGLQSSNAQARTKAITFMGTVRRAVGPSVIDLIDDLNPQLLQLVEAEFERVGDQPMPEPIHVQQGLSSTSANDNGSNGGDGGSNNVDGGDPMDDLFPRQDLNALIGPAVYKRLSDNNWKERKAALDQIHTALESVKHRIQPNISPDLYTALKQRLQDPNKNLVAVALGLLGTLSTDSNSALVANIRLVALQAIQCLSDKKVQVRAAALTALSAWATANDTAVDQAVLPAIPNALADNSPELRSSLLRWIADVLGARQTKSGRLPDLSSLISSLFSCLQDRSAEVRKQATRVLSLTVASCGFEVVHDVCNMQLRGAALNTVLPMVEEFRNTIGTVSAANSLSANTSRTRPGAGAAHRGLGNADRASSPAPEPVMTASELLGRATIGSARTSSPMSSAVGIGAAPAASGPGMLRRPMAVRRPAGAIGGAGAGLSGMRQARPMRGPSSSTDSSRPGSSMRTTTPAAQSMASQLARMSAEELENIPPILDCDFRAKEQRARRDMAVNPHGTPKWAMLSDSRIRADLEGQLREHMTLHFNPLIHKLLFSTGHYRDRDFLGGLTTMEEVITITSLSQQRFGLPLHSESPDEDSLANRCIANIDLLLKYVSLRMHDGSTHTMLKSFDLLEHLIRVIEEAQRHDHQQSFSWSDYEVQAVVPALICRLGDAKEAVRARSRRLLTQLITHLYPTTKLFIMLLEHGVQNRSNSRIRQEALDSICFLIRERTAGLGLNAVCSHPDRAIPLIVKCIADRDSSVRAAALNAMVAMGEQLPGGAEELWRYSGKMDPKERVMLEEKLKRSSIGLGLAPGSSFETAVQRPGSRLGMGQLVGTRVRAPQYGAPGAGAGALRMGTGIVRPANVAGAGGLGRSGIGASRQMQTRPSSLAQPSTHYSAYSNDLGSRSEHPVTEHQQPVPVSAPFQFGGNSASGTTSATNVGKPMFTLDFDNLSLPSYSTATKEQLVTGHDTSVRAPVTATAPVLSSASARDGANSSNPDYSSNTSSAIGYGAGRSNNLRSALSAIQANRDPASTATAFDRDVEMAQDITPPRSPVASTAAGGGQIPEIYGVAHGPGDFAFMNDVERIQWLDCVVADLKSENFGAIEMAIERLHGLVLIAEQQASEPNSLDDPSKPALMHIRKNVERIVMALMSLVHWSYAVMPRDMSLGLSQRQSLSRVHLETLDLLNDMFSNRDIALWLPLGALQTMLREMIERILDPTLKSDDSSQERSGGVLIQNAERISRILNTFTMKILDNCDRTSVYVALINLLDLSMAEGSPKPPQTDDQILRMEFGEMAMKCIWRTTKPLNQTLYMQFMDAIDSSIAVIPHEQAYPRLGGLYVHPAIRVDLILHCSHRFFEHIPDSEWRKRENKNVWMYGDMPKRTVKTVNHAIVSTLYGLVWQFTGLIIRDVMEKHPGLIIPPPDEVLASDETTLDPTDPRLARWVDDTHRKLMRVSETWTFLSTTLSRSSKELERPALAQLVSAFRESQTAEADDQQQTIDIAAYLSSNDHRHGGTPQQPQLPSRPGSVMSTSSSPYQQPRILSQSSPTERTNSPALAPGRASYLYAAASNRASSPLNSGSEYPRSMHSPPQQQHQNQNQNQQHKQPPVSSYTYTAGSAAGSKSSGTTDSKVNQERLNALRERILGNRSSGQSSHALQTQQASAPPAAPESSASKLPSRLAGPSDTVPNMDDIRQKIALMRNSLRNQKQ